MNANSMPHVINSARKTYVCHSNRNNRQNVIGIDSPTDTSKPIFRSVRLPFLPK